MIADDAMTEERRIKLIAALLMSEPGTLVACGLGTIKGEVLAKHLLALSTNKKDNP